MSTSTKDEEDVSEKEGVNAESQAEWLTEQAVLGGKILEEIRASAAKRKMPLVAYLMALYIEYAAIRDELVTQSGEGRVKDMEEGFRTLADWGMAPAGRLKRWNPTYA